MSLRELFVGYTLAHGIFTPGEVNAKGKVQKKEAATVSGEPSEYDWERHQRGEAPGLGMVPLLDDDESVMWGAIDIDVYGVDHADIEKRCAAVKLPIVLTKSKSGGAHLWLFCKEPLPATLVQAKLAEIAAWLGFGGCEVFPKQCTRANSKDVGNWINLPYYGETRRMVQGGVEQPLEAFLAKAEATRCTIGQVMLIDLAPKEEFFKDGPPCLQKIHKDGWVEGARNNGLFSVGVYFRMKNPDSWEKDLIEYNMEHLSDPLPVREVQAICDNVRKKDYGYTCKQPPIAQFCNKSACIKREFGIGSGVTGELDVTLGVLSKYDSRPPMWVVEINAKRIQIETEDLMIFGRFQKVCVENINKLPKALSPKVWTATVGKLLDEVNILSAPEDASPAGQFLALVTEFIRERARPAADELQLGNVWVEGNWAHFRSTDLVNFLRRNSFTNFAVPRMFSILADEMKARQGEIKIKGASTPYWKVEIESIQTEAFDTPNFEGVF